MEAVKNAVQNGIENLSGTSVTMNAHPDDGYRFDARTREELLASQDLVASHGNIRAGKEVRDPVADPSPEASEASQGWLL